MIKESKQNDKIKSIMDKIASPISKVAEVPVVNSVKNGLIATMPLTIIGGIFLLLFALSSPGKIGLGGAILPFLTPIADKLILVYQLTMNMLALYASISMAIEYGKYKGVEPVPSAIIGLMAFILITTNVVKDSTIAVDSFSAVGLFGSMISSILSIWFYSFCVKKNIVIKMPVGVPSAVGNAFSALLPYIVVVFLTWLIRTVLNFDLVFFLSTVLKPLFSASDSVVGFSIRNLISLSLWSVGMHGDMMIAGITDPLKIAWITDNATAYASGVSALDLPHIWSNALERMSVWPASVWGLIFWMYFSKVKYIKTLAIATTPAAIFTILEPIIFGLPIAMNPFLMIPFILSGVVSGALSYGAFELQLIARPFIELPWATPPFINGFIASGGDWKAIPMVGISFLIGITIYAPFFKQFEKHELAKQLTDDLSTPQE